MPSEQCMWLTVAGIILYVLFSSTSHDVFFFLRSSEVDGVRITRVSRRFRRTLSLGTDVVISTEGEIMSKGSLTYDDAAKGADREMLPVEKGLMADDYDA